MSTTIEMGGPQHPRPERPGTLSRDRSSLLKAVNGILAGPRLPAGRTQVPSAPRPWPRLSKKYRRPYLPITGSGESQ